MGNIPPAPPHDALAAAAAAPVIAVTYSSTELADFPEELAWQPAFRAVVEAGATPLTIDCASPQPWLEEKIGLADGLLVLGGGDVDPTLYGGDASDPRLDNVNPLRDQNELRALSLADDAGLPVLAICRGFQLLNVARGGRLTADLERDQPGLLDHRPGMDALPYTHHTVTLDPASTLAAWMGTVKLDVNSQHHQGILHIGEGLEAVAHTDDGLVEAVEGSEGRTVGVQWHPEFLWHGDPHALALLGGFVQACAAAKVHARGNATTNIPF